MNGVFYMNISIITASFPVDQETLAEVKELCALTSAVDGCHYEAVLNIEAASMYGVTGFFVLAYDDEANQLVGVGSAIDMIGLHTYEWSIIVAPMYRKVGIGGALVSVVQEGLDQRGAEGQLGLVITGAPYGQMFIEQNGYEYSFSEATLEAGVQKMIPNQEINIRRFVNEHTELVEIFSAAFGDLPDESAELIAYNTSGEGRILWVARKEEKVVGTVTSFKEGNVQWVTALAVNPDYEGQGIGSTLLAWVKDYALRNGEKYVMLDVEIENEKALRVYEKAGFLKALQIDYFAKK